MIDKVYVDFGATFGQGIFLGVQPKMVNSVKDDFKSPKVQATDVDNVPKWTAVVAVQTETFGETRTETLNVTMTSRTAPGGDLTMGTPVMFAGMQMGVMAKKNGGFSTYFQAEQIVNAATGVVSGQKAKAE